MEHTGQVKCKECGQFADHYPNGTIARHKVYEYEIVKGKRKKTTRWRYCNNTSWR